MAESTAGSGAGETPEEGAETRRDFLILAAGGMTGVATLASVWPLVNSLNPAADVLALSTTEVDLSLIEVGQRITVMWQGKPVFVDHRTAEQIDAAANISQEEFDDLIDPEADADRVQKPEWLVMVGVCTHLGCIPKGQKSGDPLGEYAGWFCPCHGSHYDTSGRIRKGPAPLNLPVPPYEFLDDTTIRIG